MQWSRPALSPPAAQEEALLFHGISRSTLISELIHPLDSVALQDPALHSFLVSDPYPVRFREYVDRWDYVFSTGMTTDYPMRRNWNNYLAFREAVQNALDQEDRTFGYDYIALNVYNDDLGVHVVNRGPPMPREAWKLGGSDKKCHERGRYGEGLKVAAAQLAREKILLYVFTGREAYKAVVPPGSNLLLIVWGRTRYHVDGAHVLAYGAVIDPKVVTEMVFQPYVRAFLPPILQRTDLSTEGCTVPRPNFIVDTRDMLWVADIYVNTLKNISGKPSLLSYNLWYVDLEPNRVTVASLPTLNRAVAEAYGPYSARLLLSRLLEYHSQHQAFQDCYEVHNVDWWAADAAVIDTVAEEMAARGLTWTDQPEAMSWFTYMGAMVLPVTESNLQHLFWRAKRAEGRVAELAEKREEEAKKTMLTRSDLNMVEAGNLHAVELLYERLNGRLGKKFKVQVVEAMGDAGGMAGMEGMPGTSLIRRTQLTNVRSAFETSLEEYAHLYGGDLYGAARDLSRPFEDALREVGAMALREMIWLPEFAAAVARASKGLWNAEVTDLRLSLDDETRRLLTVVRLDVNKDPPLFLAVSQEGELLRGPSTTYWGTDTLTSIRATGEDWERFWGLTVNPMLTETIVKEPRILYVYKLLEDSYRRLR